MSDVNVFSDLPANYEPPSNAEVDFDSSSYEKRFLGAIKSVLSADPGWSELERFLLDSLLWLRVDAVQRVRDAAFPIGTATAAESLPQDLKECHPRDIYFYEPIDMAMISKCRICHAHTGTTANVCENPGCRRIVQAGEQLIAMAKAEVASCE